MHPLAVVPSTTHATEPEFPLTAISMLKVFSELISQNPDCIVWAPVVNAFVVGSPPSLDQQLMEHCSQ